MKSFELNGKMVDFDLAFGRSRRTRFALETIRQRRKKCLRVGSSASIVFDLRLSRACDSESDSHTPKYIRLNSYKTLTIQYSDYD